MFFARPLWLANTLPIFLHSHYSLLLGPYIVFAGGAWNLRPNVQTFATLSMSFHATDDWSLSNAARHLAALRKALRSLKEYYERPPYSDNRLADTIPATTVCHIFPHLTSYQSSEGAIEFEYEKQVADKLLFFGKTKPGGDPICIKFVRRYSKEAHEFCANRRFAPPLRAFSPIPGGWFVVVMDTLTDYISLYNSPMPRTSSVFGELYKRLEEFLKDFHTAGFVHGDIRDTNIMISPDGRDIKLVDFDWAGSDRCYPYNVNTDDIWRPGDVQGLAVIKPCHDVQMLE